MEKKGVSQNYRYRFGGPHNKDYNILGSILGSPCFGNYQKQPEKYAMHEALSGFEVTELRVEEVQSVTYESINLKQ